MTKIFVFGSNLAGRHGKGAALFARQKHGAIHGQGVGLQGTSYAIPTNFNTQSRAILQALKTYGMYLADGGSALYIQGEPSASWGEDTFSQVQSVSSSQFEAVDLSEISKRAGFDPNSATVP